MQIEQISVFMENKSGRLSELTAMLTEAGIAVKAMILADLSDFGVLRMIVDDAPKAKSILKHQGFVVNASSVFSIDFDNPATGIQQVLDALNEAAINVEYMYAFADMEKGKTTMFFMVDNPEKAYDLINTSRRDPC